MAVAVAEPVFDESSQPRNRVTFERISDCDTPALPDQEFAAALTESLNRPTTAIRTVVQLSRPYLMIAEATFLTATEVGL